MNYEQSLLAMKELELLLEEQERISEQLDLLEKHIDGLNPIYATELFIKIQKRSAKVDKRIQELSNQIENQIN